MAIGNTLLENIGQSHPLFLSIGDNSGAILISLHLSGSENYSIWSRAMKLEILGRNKLGFIDGTCKKADFGSNLVALRERCNVIMLSWIMNCVSKELLGGIMYSSDAASVWYDLKEKFDSIALVPRCDCPKS